MTPVQARPARRAVPVLLTATAIGVLVAATLGAGAASAHAELDDTVPRAGAVLEGAPGEIVLDFDDEVISGLSYVGLFDPDGVPVRLGEPIDTPDHTQLVLPVTDPAVLGAGAYVVAYRVTSVDGHVRHASYAFQIGTRAADQAAAVKRLVPLTDPADAGWSWTVGVLRAFGLVGFALVLGAMSLGLLGASVSGRVRTAGTVGAAAVALAALLGIGAQCGLSSAGGADALVDGSLWSEVLGTRMGVLLGARAALGLVAVFVLAAGVRAPARSWRLAGVLVAMCLLLTHSLSGHAALGRLAALGVLLDVVHLAVALVWLGGLALMLLDRRMYLRSDALAGDADDDPAQRVTSLWARWTFVAAGLVVVTGVLQLWRTVDAPSSLLETAYGRTLLGKTVLVVLVLVLMAMGRSALRRLGTIAVRPFLAVETVLALLLVAVSAGLAGAAPNARTPAVPVTVRAEADGVAASFTLTPAAVGSNDVHLVVSQPGSFEASRAARAVLDNPARGLTSLVIPLSPDGPDHYSAYALQIPAAGTWDVRIEIDTAEGGDTAGRTVTVVITATVEVSAR